MELKHNPPSIGNFLQKTRMDKNVSIKMVSQKTKIGMTLLEHLEADDFKKLPNKTYIIGFIKSYAKSLGANERECLNSFYQTYKAYEKATTPPLLPTNHPPKQSKQSRRSKHEEGKELHQNQEDLFS